MVAADGVSAACSASRSLTMSGDSMKGRFEQSLFEGCRLESKPNRGLSSERQPSRNDASSCAERPSS
jgi:hypothetical protein